MYRYTPNKEILEKLKAARKKGYVSKIACSGEYHLATSMFKDYAMKVAFLTHWEHTNVFSKTKLKEVPVSGYLFPVDLFDQTKV